MMDNEDIYEFTRKAPCLLAITGSRAHGTHTEKSDVDIRGVWVAPNRDFLNPFTCPDKTVTRTNGIHDIQLWELNHFASLAAKGNPTIIDVLFTPPVFADQMGRYLLTIKELFISQLMFKSYLGYAQSELACYKSRVEKGIPVEPAHVEPAMRKDAARIAHLLFALDHFLYTDGNVLVDIRNYMAYDGVFAPDAGLFINGINSGQYKHAKLLEYFECFIEVLKEQVSEYKGRIRVVPSYPELTYHVLKMREGLPVD